MRRSFWLLLAAVFWLAACASPAAAPATQAPAQPAEQRPVAAQPTEAPAVPAQPAPAATLAPLPTGVPPKLNPPRSGGVLNPPTNVPTPGNNPANIDATAPFNWTTYHDDAIGLSFQYPVDWQKQLEPGSQPVQRISVGRTGQSREKNTILIIEVWKRQAGLLTWLRTQIPAGQLLIGSTGLEGGSTSYHRFNASLAGQPAVFLYRPAKSPTPGRAALFTADKQYVYQFTYFGDTADDLVNRAIYLHMLNSVIISGSISSGLALPSTEFTTGVDVDKFK